MKIYIDKKVYEPVANFENARKNKAIKAVFAELPEIFPEFVFKKKREHCFFIDFSEFEKLCKKHNVTAGTCLKYVFHSIEYYYNMEEAFSIPIHDIDGELFTDFSENPHKTGIHAFYENNQYLIIDVKKQLHLCYSEFTLEFDTPDGEISAYISTNFASTDCFEYHTIDIIDRWIYEKYGNYIDDKCTGILQDKYDTCDQKNYNHFNEEVSEMIENELTYYTDSIKISPNFLEPYTNNYKRYRFFNCEEMDFHDFLHDFLDKLE